MSFKQLFTVREIREMSKLTQAEFAEVIGMSVNTYIFKERKNKFYFHEVYDICSKVGVDITSIDPYETTKF